MSDPVATWTDRLLDLASGLDRETARRFVHDLYAAAQQDLDERQAAAEFERDE